MDELTELLAQLVEIDSVNPSLAPGGRTPTGPVGEGLHAAVE